MYLQANRKREVNKLNALSLLLFFCILFYAFLLQQNQYFYFFLYLFYLYIYPPDSQESDGGANT